MRLLPRNAQHSLMSAYLPGAAPSSGLLTRDVLVRGLGWHRRGKTGPAEAHGCPVLEDLDLSIAVQQRKWLFGTVSQILGTPSK